MILKTKSRGICRRDERNWFEICQLIENNYLCRERWELHIGEIASSSAAVWLYKAVSIRLRPWCFYLTLNFNSGLVSCIDSHSSIAKDYIAISNHSRGEIHDDSSNHLLLWAAEDIAHSVISFCYLCVVTAHTDNSHDRFVWSVCPICGYVCLWLLLSAEVVTVKKLYRFVKWLCIICAFLLLGFSLLLGALLKMTVCEGEMMFRNMVPYTQSPCPCTTACRVEQNGQKKGLIFGRWTF